MPWSTAEHARALLHNSDTLTLPRTAEITLRKIAGEDLPATLPDDNELVYVARAVTESPVTHRFGDRDGVARCGSPLSYGTKNALLPYAHAASFASDCGAGCFS